MECGNNGECLECKPEKMKTAVITKNSLGAMVSNEVCNIKCEEGHLPILESIIYHNIHLSLASKKNIVEFMKKI